MRSSVSAADSPLCLTHPLLPCPKNPIPSSSRFSFANRRSDIWCYESPISGLSAVRHRARDHITATAPQDRRRVAIQPEPSLGYSTKIEYSETGTSTPSTTAQICNV